MTTVMRQNMLDFIYSVQLMKQKRQAKKNPGDPGAFTAEEMGQKEGGQDTCVGCEVVPRTRPQNLRSK